MIEYLCLNKKCSQIQTIDEIHDEDTDCLYCSYCMGSDFFEREADECDLEDTDIMEIAAERLTQLSRPS